MKRVLVLMLFAAMFLMATSQTSQAQTDETATTTQQLTEQAQTSPATGEAVLHKEIKRLFIEGGAGFMGVILLCLILGLAIAIERIIYLNLATTNTDKLLARIDKGPQGRGSSMQPKRFAGTPGDLWQASSTRALTEPMRVSKWQRNPL